MNVTVKLDMRQFDAAIARLKDQAPRAVAAAVNRAATAAVTQLARDTARDMKLKVGTVKANIGARGQASPATPSVTLTASAKPIPAIEFGARGPEPSRGRGRGVTAKLPGRRYPRAFIATMRSGHRGVFQRTGKARLPIRQLMGPSVWFVASKHAPAAARRAEQVMIERLRHEIQRALKAQ
jgi:hypothetical protein